MEHHCSLCPYFSCEVDCLIRHVQHRHKHCTNFVIYCSVCGASFRNAVSFGKHYYRKHFHNVTAVTMQTDLEELEESNIDVMEVNSACSMSKTEEGVYLLRLKAAHRLSNKGVDDVMSATKELIGSKCNLLTTRLRQSGLLTNEIQNEISSTLTVFSGLETSYKQERFLEQLGLVKPVAAQLGFRTITQNNRGKRVCNERAVYGYYVPFISQLTALLSMPEIHRCVHYPVPQTGELMTDFTDGFVIDAPLLNNNTHLLFSLYSDELEIVNPIGSHRKIHKIIVFYWCLLNIPPQFRSKMHVIQLAAVAKSSYVKQYGCNALLDDLCSAFIALKSGIDLNISGYGKITYTGSLSFVLADTVAAQYLGGFNESVGPAYNPCRTCEVSKNSIPEISFCAMQCRAL